MTRTTNRAEDLLHPLWSRRQKLSFRRRVKSLEFEVAPGCEFPSYFAGIKSNLPDASS
jgi:hypothetical protein